MRIIGLTGGIASGKSMAAQVLRDLGAEVIDADIIGHEIMDLGLPAYREIVAHFGTGILDSEGRINRKVLGNIVFSNPEQLEVLNRITHPRIFDRIKEIVHRLRQQQVQGLIVIEAALLFEIHLHELVDEVWTVETHPAIQVQRLQVRNSLTEEEALERIKAQMKPEDRIALSDRVILNNSGRETLVRQILAFLDCT